MSTGTLTFEERMQLRERMPWLVRRAWYHFQEADICLFKAAKISRTQQLAGGGLYAAIGYSRSLEKQLINRRRKLAVSAVAHALLAWVFVRTFSQGSSAWLERRSHNPEVSGSNPLPASNSAGDSPSPEGVVVEAGPHRAAPTLPGVGREIFARKANLLCP